MLSFAQNANWQILPYRFKEFSKRKYKSSKVGETEEVASSDRDR